MCFNECVCLSSRSSIFCAVDCSCMSFTASLTVSSVLAGVWVLDDTLLIISEAVASGVVAVVDCDVAVEWGGSGYGTGGWGSVGLL
jgi:hypothetical protein